VSVTEAATRARVDALIDRIVTNPGEKLSDRDLAFRLCVLRRWVVRVGADGAEAEFHTVRDGQRLGWKITRRGHQVAEQHLAGPEDSARG
jgi:hypothetical protein